MITLKRQNKKWEKRPQLYRGRFYYLKQISQAALFLSTLVSLVALWVYLQKSDALFIRHVVVTGELKHTTADEVKTLSGITPQDKLFTVNLKSITENLECFAWISEAKVRREFPDTIQIDVTENHPIALLKMSDFYYVNEEGRVFKKLSDTDDTDLPVITGFDQDFVTKYPQLSKTYLKKVLGVLSFLEAQPFYKVNSISEFSFDPVFGYTVYTLENALEVYYGRDDVEAKQNKLEMFSKSQHFNIAEFMRLDLDAREKIVARKVTPVVASVVKEKTGLR